MKSTKNPPDWIPRSWRIVRIHFVGVASGFNHANQDYGVLIGPVPVSANADPWLEFDMTPFVLVRSALELWSVGEISFSATEKRGFDQWITGFRMRLILCGITSAHLSHSTVSNRVYLQHVLYAILGISSAARGTVKVAQSKIIRVIELYYYFCFFYENQAI